MRNKRTPEEIEAIYGALEHILEAYPQLTLNSLLEYAGLPRSSVHQWNRTRSKRNMEPIVSSGTVSLGTLLSELTKTGNGLALIEELTYMLEYLLEVSM